MMDNPEYAEETCRKIQRYGQEGYILGVNFIATFESKNVPLSSTTIDDAIKQVFFAGQDK